MLGVRVPSSGRIGGLPRRRAFGHPEKCFVQKERCRMTRARVREEFCYAREVIEAEGRSQLVRFASARERTAWVDRNPTYRFRVQIDPPVMARKIAQGMTWDDFACDHVYRYSYARNEPMGRASAVGEASK